jgi:hypothetical protein
MHVDTARAANPVARELGLDAVDHGAETLVALRLHQRIDVVTVVGPSSADRLRPLRRIGLVPHRDVGVDGVGDVAHFR